MNIYIYIRLNKRKSVIVLFPSPYHLQVMKVRRNKMMPVSWSLLPSEIWEKIGKRLVKDMDTEAFRWTCKSWRNLIPSPSPSIFPLQIPPPPFGSPYKTCLTQSTVYLIHPDPDSVVFLVLGTTSKGLSPRRLLQSSWFAPLKHDQLQQLRKSLLNTSYHIGCETKKCELLSYYSDTNQPVVMNPKFAAVEKGVDLVAVTLLKRGGLAHLKLNPSSMEWRLVSHPSNSKFDDIIKHGAKLWGVDLDGDAFVINSFDNNNRMASELAVRSPVMVKEHGLFYVNDKPTPYCTPFNYKKEVDDPSNDYDKDCVLRGRKRFVEASGVLYMLFPSHHLIDNETHIKVFQLTYSNSRKEYSWLETESIGNKGFFVGVDFSFSMEIGADCFNENHAAHGGNCIFLEGFSFCRGECAQHDYPLFIEMLKPGRPIGVYSLVDKKFRQITPLDTPQIFCTDFVRKLLSL